MEVPSESTEVSPRDALLLKLGLDESARAEDLERAYRKRLKDYEAQVEHAGSKPERVAAKGTLKSFEQLLPQVRAEAARLRIDGLLEECREGLEKKRVGAVTRKLAAVRTLCDENNLEDHALTREIEDLEGDLEDVRLILGIPAGGGAESPGEDAPVAEAAPPEVPEADLPKEDASESAAEAIAEPMEHAEAHAAQAPVSEDAPAIEPTPEPEEAAAEAAPAEAAKVIQPPPLPPNLPKTQPPAEAEPPPETEEAAAPVESPVDAEAVEESEVDAPSETAPEPEAEPTLLQPPPIIAEYTPQATAAPASSDAPFAPMAALCFSLAGPEEERVHILSQEQLVFGRSRDCDVVVRAYAPDEDTARQLSRKISRAHFTIERRADDVQLADGSVVEGRRKRSGNGTYADGQPVDTIQIFRTGVETLKLTREGDAQAPPSWSLELVMECPLGASAHPAFAHLPKGPQALLLKRMDGLCEDLLLLWGCANLRVLGLAEEDLWLARLAGGYGLWDGTSLVPLEPGFRVGATWTATGFDALDYAKLIT
ncbi:MAG: FHA domain-containing protein [Opitutales bacterium]